MPAEERGPDLRQVRNVARSRGLAQSLATPLDRVRRLQTSLQAKAKWFIRQVAPFQSCLKLEEP